MKQLIIAAVVCMATAGAIAQDHAGHAHEDSHGHGEHIDLGTTTVAGIKFEVEQLGKLAGKEAAIEVVLVKDAPKPKAVRLWIGLESAEGSAKARAEGEGPEYEVHVELPNPMPAGAKLWVEMQSADSKKARASFDLKK